MAPCTSILKRPSSKRFQWARLLLSSLFRQLSLNDRTVYLIRVRVRCDAIQGLPSKPPLSLLFRGPPHRTATCNSTAAYTTREHQVREAPAYVSEENFDCRVDFHVQVGPVCSATKDERLKLTNHAPIRYQNHRTTTLFQNRHLNRGGLGSTYGWSDYDDHR